MVCSVAVFSGAKKGSTEKGGQGVQKPLIKAVGRVGKRKREGKRKEGTSRRRNIDFS